jgi:predicted AlkP superfamily pyrophosphatase or phosphodiesterase
VVVLNVLLLAGALAIAPDPPRLVVIVVVDQMRGDYLQRFAPIFAADGGFERFRAAGRLYTRAFHEHAVTATAPGHATLATGCDPARHGMVANQIPTEVEGEFRLAGVDEKVKTVGGDAKSSSPRDLLVPALGDWLKAASPDSQVVSLALKNRSAVLLGGQHPDVCCWFDDKNARYVTSTWYSETLPAFVTAFDRDLPASAEIGNEWRPMLTDAQFDAVGCTADAMPYEGRLGLATTADSTFPHKLEKPGDFTFNPRGDERTLELAALAVKDLALGNDDAPDLLYIGLSAADYVGHAYGPDSRELADHYARLDRALGVLMRTIESAAPSERVIYVLSADHGVSPIVENLISRGLDAGRIPVAAFTKTLDRALDREFGDADWIDGVLPDVYLDAAAIAKSGRSEREVADYAARIARAQRGIEDAWTREQLMRPTPVVPEPFRRAFHPQRSGEVILAFKPYWQLDYLDTVGYVKTNHSTHHEFDRHIPMYFAGGGVTPGLRTERFSSVDLAPTLAKLLGVNPPEDIDGRARDLFE